MAGRLLVSVCLLNYCLQVISDYLSGASFASVTDFSILVGMASAMETLCGQSYGAKQHHMLGIHMQRAMLILMIVSIPLAIIWTNTRSILIYLGQDLEISAEAGQHARLMIPSLFAYGLLQFLNRFLETQNIVFPMMFSSGVSYCFTTCSYMSSSNAISYWIIVLILTLHVKFSPSSSKNWTGFST